MTWQFIVGRDFSIQQELESFIGVGRGSLVMGAFSGWWFLDMQEEQISEMIDASILQQRPSLPAYGCLLIHVYFFNRLIKYLSNVTTTRWFSPEMVSTTNNGVLMCAYFLCVYAYYVCMILMCACFSCVMIFLMVISHVVMILVYCCIYVW